MPNPFPMTLLLRGVLASAFLFLLFLGSSSADRHDAAGDGDIIPGRYIVVLRGGTDAEGYANALALRHGFVPDVTYQHVFAGFAANLSNAAAAALRKDPNVLSVEPDRIVTVSGQVVPKGIDRIDAEIGLLGDDPVPDVDIAILDTGVDIDHPDLRVAGGVGFSQPCGDGSGSYDDDHFHGTHVAGVAAARDNDFGVVGVAPGARIWSVKIAPGGNTTESCAIEGVEWVTCTRTKAAECPQSAMDANPIEVANMSFALALGDSNNPLCWAIASSVEAGVVYVAAAGNNSADAGNYSPAHCPAAITASNVLDADGQPGNDFFYPYSNRGSVVDIAAPGVDILSTFLDGGYISNTGTSAAAPHVAGAAARYMAQRPTSTPAEVREHLLAAAIPQSDEDCGFSGDPDDFPEPLIYVGVDCDEGDYDYDLVSNGPDNCPLVSNPAQTDTDSDGIGDACDPDDDNDTITDVADNCPAWPNSNQSLPPWPVAEDDPDCDGWSTDHEDFIGTDPLDPCPDDPSDEAWPPDIDSSTSVDIIDALMFGPVMLSNPGDDEYDPRFNLNAADGIDIIDVLMLGSFVQESCSNP